MTLTALTVAASAPAVQRAEQRDPPFQKAGCKVAALPPTVLIQSPPPPSRFPPYLEGHATIRCTRPTAAPRASIFVQDYVTKSGPAHWKTIYGLLFLDGIRPISAHATVRIRTHLVAARDCDAPLMSELRTEFIVGSGQFIKTGLSAGIPQHIIVRKYSSPITVPDYVPGC